MQNSPVSPATITDNNVRTPEAFENYESENSTTAKVKPWWKEETDDYVYETPIVNGRAVNPWTGT